VHIDGLLDGGEIEVEQRQLRQGNCGMVQLVVKGLLQGPHPVNNLKLYYSRLGCVILCVKQARACLQLAAGEEIHADRNASERDLV
jgi:hypothetical protein